MTESVAIVLAAIPQPWRGIIESLQAEIAAANREAEEACKRARTFQAERDEARAELATARALIDSHDLIADLAAARALLRDLREAIEPMIGFVARYECPKSGWPTAPDDIVIVDGVKLETPRRLASLATKIDALLEEVSK